MITLLNFATFPILMMSVGYWATHRTMNFDAHFHPLYKIRLRETAQVYEKIVFIRIWKDWLPDGAVLFTTGFQKKKLARRDEAYLREFVTETCRGEIAHWIDIALLPLFWIWNPFWSSVIVTIFGILINLPCIITQRYNRIRFLQVLQKKAFTHHLRK